MEEANQDESKPTPAIEFKNSKYDKKSEKSKSDKQSTKNSKDNKISKAKDGLNIEVNNERLHDIGRNISKHKQSGSSKGSKKSNKSSRAESKV